MGIHKGVAVAVSSLVLGGAVALTVGAATPASAGDSHRGSSAIRVYNKNFNFSRSDSEQAQRARQRHDHHQSDHEFSHFNDDYKNAVGDLTGRQGGTSYKASGGRDAVGDGGTTGGSGGGGGGGAGGNVIPVFHIYLSDPGDLRTKRSDTPADPQRQQEPAAQ